MSRRETLIDNQASVLEREALDGLRTTVSRLSTIVSRGPRTGKLAQRVARLYLDLCAAAKAWEDAARQPQRDPGTPPDLV